MNMTYRLIGIVVPVLLLAGCGQDKPAGEEATVVEEPVIVEQASTEPVVMAYGRFVPEREDDFTWENDKVAFRIYGPSSGGQGPVSGVDPWFKKVDYSIIDKWYAEHFAGQSYHEDNGEGHDIYHVGPSRGAGGTAIWIDGVEYPAAMYKSYEVHQSGGDVVEFTVQYEWDTPLGAVAESKTISLALGSQLYQVNSVFTLDGEPASLPIAIGLATHDEAAEVFSNPETGRISTWEIMQDKGVGTGALLAPGRVIETLHARSEEKDASHIWMITASGDDGTLTFRAGFAWEAAGEITSSEQWAEFLDAAAGH